MEISSLHCCRWERHFLCCEQQTSTENSLFEEILKASAWEPQATALISTWWIHSRTGKKKKHKTTLLLCALCEVLIEFTIYFVCAIPFLISVGKDYNEAKDKNHNGQTRNKINNHQANCRKKKDFNIHVTIMHAFNVLKLQWNSRRVSLNMTEHYTSYLAFSSQLQ